MKRISTPSRIVLALVANLLLISGARAQMKLHFINVGQGSSCLVEYPCGVILIDTGGESNAEFDSNAALTDFLSDFFKQHGQFKNTFQCVYLTHPHIDHTRGVPEILTAPYKIKNVVTNGQESGSGGPQQKKLHRLVEASEDTPSPTDDIGFDAVKLREIPNSGLSNKVIDPVKCSGTDPVIKVLWGALPSNWNSAEAKNANNNSLVIRLEYGKSSVIITGDLEDAVIDKLVEKYEGTNLLDADLYVCGHHGSKNGTTQNLLDKISPLYAVISMGSIDREVPWTAWAYGHPNKNILDQLQEKVQKKREPIVVQAGNGAKNFSTYTVTSAIYATAWDNALEFVADATGNWQVPGGVQEALVNINTATVAELQQLPGIGETKARAIVSYRTKNGKFGSVDDLAKVPGIGAATVNRIEGFAKI